jgi:hypothetical protein
MKDKVDRELKDVVLITTRQTSYDAKMFAPVDKAGLKSSIRPFNKGKTGEVIVGVKYGPYIDFGTGTKVKVPAELTDYAMQFKGKGIRQVNLSARPYLYPAFFINREKFINACDKILKNL